MSVNYSRLQPSDTLLKTYIPAFQVGLTPCLMTELLHYIDGCLADKRKIWMDYANIDTLCLLRQDASYQATLNRNAHLVMVDGTWVMWLARMAGAYIPQRMALTDVVPEVMAHATEQDYSVFVLGSNPETMYRAKSVLHDRGHLPHTVACWSEPRERLLNKAYAQNVLAHINEVQPDILMVALGAPFQNRWIQQHWDQLPPCAVMMVGGAFDYLAGTVLRAPDWMQVLGMEWLFRMMTDHQKRERSLFERYVLTDAPFTLKMMWNIANRRNPRPLMILEGRSPS